ncbi:MAG: hypothetical protein V3T83_07360 [Acidobacteriota bacterium]
MSFFVIFVADRSHSRTLEAVGWDSQGRPSKSVLGRGAEAEAECLPGFKLPLRILFD